MAGAEVPAEGAALLVNDHQQGGSSLDSADEGCELRAEADIAATLPRRVGVRGVALATAAVLAVVGCSALLPSRRAGHAALHNQQNIIGEAFGGAPQGVHPQVPPDVPFPDEREREPEEVLVTSHRPVLPPAPPPRSSSSEAPTAPPTTAAPTTAAPTTTPEPTPDPKFDKCPATGGDCRDDKCCKDPGTQCFEKNEYWAECKATCEEGMHLTDPDDTPWTCKPLGDKTPGEPAMCSSDGEDCSKTECCAEPGMQCYRKGEFWATCKPACQPGPDLMAPEPDSWSCEEVGARNPGAGDWVAEKGAKAGQNCAEVGFCAESWHQCYKKDDGWSECRTECEPGFKENEWDTAWSCEAVGPKTPRSTWPGAPAVGQVAAWVPKTCKSEGENCLDTKCCKSVGWRCHKKNEFWGQCLWECPPGAAAAAAAEAQAAADKAAAEQAAQWGRRLADEEDDEATKDTEEEAPAEEETWDCGVIGPESWGLAIKGYPSLYCISLYMPNSYEGGLMNQQLEMDAGIFACDGYDVLAAEDVTMGMSNDGILVKSLLIPKIEVGVSQDGTAGNAKLFMAMWDQVIAGKRFRDYDWTIKADPDAVLIPWRLRDHMRPHVGENVYVVNCNKFPSSPNFPMMFGSVEIFSSAAMITYADKSWKCGQDLPWGSWGEDYYMTHCLDYIGVGRISEFSVVGDNVCTGANCADGSVASFHPMKTAGDWKKCWEQAVPPGT